MGKIEEDYNALHSGNLVNHWPDFFQVDLNLCHYQCHYQRPEITLVCSVAVILPIRDSFYGNLKFTALN